LADFFSCSREERMGRVEDWEINGKKDGKTK
jgi:hypothetical protein